jgi:hypothetical protein
MSVSDIMAGLMVIFLFIAIAYMKKVYDPAENVELSRSHLCKQLRIELEDKLILLGGEIDQENCLLIRFSEVAKYELAEVTVPKQLISSLQEFIPKYVSVLKDFEAKYPEMIEEIRIAGHTSSENHGSSSDLSFRSYVTNMKISQQRSHNVLETSLEILNEQRPDLREWVQYKLVSNGMSFRNRIKIGDSEVEDAAKSRRVEFVVKLNSYDAVRKIFESNQNHPVTAH